VSIYNRSMFFLELLTAHLLHKRVPLAVIINCTHRCNLACGYCYGEYYKSSPKASEFTLQELYALIDELGALGTRSVTLAGGEPLIRDDIGLIIRKLKSRGIECGMNTNGTLIPIRLKELKDIDMVTVSIDGPKDMNDANRGKGSFEKIMAGIEAALRAGVKLHINAVLTRHNLECVDWITQFARENKIQAEFNILFNQSAEKKGSNEFAAETESFRRALTRIADLKAKGAPILFSERVYRFASQWPDLSIRLYRENPAPFKSIRCFAGRFMCIVDADGKVYPCFQLIDCMDALNCRDAGFKKAWDYIARHDCKACYFPCFNEFNSIMALDPKVLMHQILSSLKGD
jgi:MoaA/NifB/PqqE/SkfB family radical SAM enzyme